MAAKDMLDTNTKDLIAEALRMIMMEKPFENIRIKDICDRVGVVRVTFYNYFIDKYAALEYLIEKDLILPNENRIREGKFEEMIFSMMNVMDAKRDYYKIAFQVGGQNGFEDQLKIMMTRVFGRILEKYRQMSVGAHELPNRVTAEYFAELFAYGMRTWLFYPKKIAVDEARRYVAKVLRKEILGYLKTEE